MKNIPMPARQGRRAEKPERAFALTDLVVLIALIAVLSGLMFTARATTGQKPGTIECKNNLRLVGLAIEQYAMDHTNSLPGPIWSGIFCDYKSTWNDRLGYYLWPYFGLPAPDGTRREINALKCPALLEAQPRPINTNDPTGFSQPLSFLSVSTVTNRPGAPPGVTNYPFGRPGSPGGALPMKITDIKRPSEQWAICDADQKNVPSGASYYAYLALEPIHNNRPGGPRSSSVGNRNYLFFDGSVQTRAAPGINP